MKTEHTEALRR